MGELGAQVCAISEPRVVPISPYWYGSKNGLAAIYWARTDPTGNCKLIRRLKDSVVVEFKGIRIISCYISPNVARADFQDCLDDLGIEIRRAGGRVLLCGDFNAK